MDESDTPLMGGFGRGPSITPENLPFLGPVLGVLSDITRKAGGSGVPAFDFANSLARKQRRLNIPSSIRGFGRALSF